MKLHLPWIFWDLCEEWHLLQKGAEIQHATVQEAHVQLFAAPCVRHCWQLKLKGLVVHVLHSTFISDIGSLTFYINPPIISGLCVFL